MKSMYTSLASGLAHYFTDKEKIKKIAELLQSICETDESPEEKLGKVERLVEWASIEAIDKNDYDNGE